MTGGQALHIWNPADMYEQAPAVFKRYKTWAHLFDKDAIRLEKTARELGVRVINVERLGKVGQHVDLCGQPLTLAIELAEKFEKSS